MNAQGFCPVALEEIEVWSAGFIQCDNLTIDYRVVREVSESVEDLGILSIEGIPPPGKEIELTGRFNGDGAISVELDLEDPIGSSRKPPGNARPIKC